MGNHEDFRDIMDHLWTGKLPPIVDTVLPFSKGERAFEILECGEMFGKIVLTV